MKFKASLWSYLLILVFAFGIAAKCEDDDTGDDAENGDDAGTDGDDQDTGAEGDILSIPECDAVTATSVDECNDVTPETGQDVCDIALCALCVGYAGITTGCDQADCTEEPYKTAIDCYKAYAQCIAEIDCSQSGDDVTPLTATCFSDYAACGQDS